MKRKFNGDDRALAYNVFYFINATRYAELFEGFEDEYPENMRRSFEDFQLMYKQFLDSDFSRMEEEGYSFEECVNGYLEDKIYETKIESI